MVSTNPIDASSAAAPAAVAATPALARGDGAAVARGGTPLILGLRVLAVLATVTASLPVLTPNAPAWVDANAAWCVTGASALVLVSFASGSRRLPFGAWTAAHLGLWLVLGGATHHLTRQNLGTLELRPHEPANTYASANGPHPLPFGLEWDDEPAPAAAARSKPEWAPQPAAAPTALAARGPRREIPRATGTNPFPGRLLVQWPARTVSVRLPVQIGKAPLLVAPGESPNPSNSFRIAFLRLVPDFVMNPATHEVSARSDAPVNPALQVREIGPGYAREHWLFGRFPEMGQHPEIHAGVGAETTGSSPLRLRYEVDVPTEGSGEPVILAEADETAALAALVQAEPPAAPRSPTGTTSTVATAHALAPRYRLTLRESGRTEVAAVRLEPTHPWHHRGWSFRVTQPAPASGGALALEVGETAGLPWVAAGAALSAVGWFRTRRRD